jgi:hypothetical protein
MEETKKETEEIKKVVEGPKTELPPKEVKMRQIIIETDGNNINHVKADVSGKIELVAVLRELIGYINSQK